MSPEPDPRAAAPTLRHSPLWIWLAFTIAFGALVWSLFHFFPEVALTGYDYGNFLYLVILVPLIARGIIGARDFTWSVAARNAAIWAAIALVLVLGYAYRDVLGSVGARLRGEFLPAEPRAAGDGTVALTETEGGSYLATGEVNGVRVRFAVDTGASDIVLSRADAARAGIDTAALAYTRENGTANGIGHGAETTVDSLTLGPIAFDHVRVMVNDAPLGTSLLGMAFLRRLKSFEFKGHKLYLRRE